MNTNTTSGIKSIEVTAVKIKADGSREELGVISSWNSNPIIRLWNWLKGK